MLVAILFNLMNILSLTGAGAIVAIIKLLASLGVI